MLILLTATWLLLPAVAPPPLRLSSPPAVGVANSFALVGLERLEKNFPILNQSTDEVCCRTADRTVR